MKVVTPVWLVGMMGAGKSSVGRALAERMGCEFRDTDADIEREAGSSVSEIFASEGEAGFRARERAAVAACAGAEAVVALGGGAIADPESSALLTARGTIVYLRARVETLLARVEDAEARPLLAGRDEAARLAKLRELLDVRAAAYAQADVCVDTDACSIDDVVSAIVDGLEAEASATDGPGAKD